MKNKAPISALTLTGARIHTAEAAMDPQPHYPANRLWTQQEIHSDLSQLPYRMQTPRTRPQGQSAVPVPPMLQDIPGDARQPA